MKTEEKKSVSGIRFAPGRELDEESLTQVCGGVNTQLGLGKVVVPTTIQYPHGYNN